MYIYMLQIIEWDLKNLLVKRYRATIRDFFVPRTPVTLTGFGPKNESRRTLQAEDPLSESESLALNDRLERLRSQFEENEKHTSGRLSYIKLSSRKWKKIERYWDIPFYTLVESNTTELQMAMETSQCEVCINCDACHQQPQLQNDDDNNDNDDNDNNVTSSVAKINSAIQSAAVYITATAKATPESDAESAESETLTLVTSQSLPTTFSTPLSSLAWDGLQSV